MNYESALLCMHGMGNLTKGEFEADIAKVKQNLAERLPANKLSNTYIPAAGIFYSDITQGQEDKIWEAMTTQGGLDTGWIRRNTINLIRRFIISGLSDATAFTGFNDSGAYLPYRDAQQRIYDALKDVHKVCGEIPIVIISQSLGCQIMSNYLWDAQLYLRNATLPENKRFPIDRRSIWYDRPYASDVIRDEFLCLQSLKTWFTTGCNIPIFVSGFKDVRAVHNNRDGYNFNWFNYFDYDDVLGYPLTPLNVLFNPGNTAGHGQSYANAATDIQVNANDGIWGTITSSWNPMSHTQYWGDNTVLEALASRV